MKIWKTRYNSEEYIEYIRSLPCCVCGSYLGVDAHHEGIFSKGGTKRKNDFQALPLCHDKCHLNGVHSGGSSFWRKIDIEPEWVALTLMREYLLSASPSSYEEEESYEKDMTVLEELIKELEEVYEEE